jgi:hypothetical protein
MECGPTWTKPRAARLEGGANQGLPIPPGVGEHLNHPKRVMTLTSLDSMVMTRGQPVAGPSTWMGDERRLEVLATSDQPYQRIEAQPERGEHGHG